jgi:hypothetical protein
VQQFSNKLEQRGFCVNSKNQGVLYTINSCWALFLQMNKVKGGFCKRIKTDLNLGSPGPPALDLAVADTWLSHAGVMLEQTVMGFGPLDQRRRKEQIKRECRGFELGTSRSEPRERNQCVESRFLNINRSR